MTPLEVIDHLDIVEYIGSRIAAGRIDLPADALTFEQLEEAFDHGVVVDVASPAHAANQVVLPQERLPLVPGELTGLI